MIDADEIKNCYRQKETAVDSRGRLVEVRRLKLSQQTKLWEMVDKPINRMTYQVAASVTKITGIDGKDVLFGFPLSQADVLVVLDALDFEGFDAASAAYAKLNGIEVKKDDNEADLNEAVA